jgi:hypothetical protein
LLVCHQAPEYTDALLASIHCLLPSAVSLAFALAVGMAQEPAAAKTREEVRSVWRTAFLQNGKWKLLDVR